MITMKKEKNMKLSKVQQETLDKMVVGRVYCAYGLGVPTRTLDALVKKGFVRRRSGLGALFDPRVNIEYMRVR